MSVTNWISAILVGIVIGVLGRLVLPGRQRIGAFVTLLIGVGSALLGTVVATAIGVSDKAHSRILKIDFHWWELAIQVGFAVVGTAIAAAITHTRLAQNEEPPLRTRKRTRSTKKA
jgi:uncharacterized membrane protein YeaQ/YmgE (transglycosylase-associated protein family)